MNTFTLEVPALYGDHHVLEIRRILFDLSGVTDVYASSSFHVVQVTYDPELIDEQAITTSLQAAGYLDPLDVPLEPETAPYGNGGRETSFRHTTAYAQTRQVVGFGHLVAYAGRPLWPCPGMGPIERVDEGE